MSGEFFEALLDEIYKQEAKRAEDMPTEKDALLRMTECVQRLKDLGWNDAMYCPKDGTVFNVIEAGSSGIHKAHYDGKWPDGTWWIHDNGDLLPSHPILFKLINE
jgi:hypothetical protein